MMKLAKDTARPQNDEKKIVSRTDAVFLMIASAAAAVLTTFMSVKGIVGYFTGPVTLELPLATRNQTAGGLELESTGHYTTLEATIPDLPSGPDELLSWVAALNQIGVLAILTLVFLLAYRLRSAVLFTAGSVWIVGVCGAILALVGTVGPILDGLALNRLAEMIAANGRTPGESYVFYFSAQFNVGPLMLGLVLVLVAGVFQYGRRLQKDTEGLV
ncbi:hypothetical protein [Arthrobacter oryzae]|uniref:hypothetical protein n=1 Tax=Arthrobacter oryzae TaxID=409290 RepID=UPI00277D59F0|nr:hypothetical protein [Arthrobacter oryzae]MDQ0075772.1 hypothetical protein [Arthrobacter oryzae]